MTLCKKGLQHFWGAEGTPSSQSLAALWLVTFVKDLSTKGLSDEFASINLGHLSASLQLLELGHCSSLCMQSSEPIANRPTVGMHAARIVGPRLSAP